MNKIFGVALLAALSLTGAVAVAEPAAAAARVTITIADKPGLSAVADSTYLTELTLTGSGFQSVQNGFGGIYVLFGWASGGNWGPSQGGAAGSDYRYVYDDENNPVGYQLFVTFPGSSTSYAANGGSVAANGTWNATIRVPGPLFQAYDRAGNVTEVNCLQTSCGIITIGAHGVHNAANESFTPITFASIYGASDNRAVVAPAEPVKSALAPTIIGGRPATIPTAIADTALTAATRAETSAEAGTDRLSVTVPGAQPDAWVGVYLHSDPVFAGWFKPNSLGQIDVNLPGDLPAGDHRVVVLNTEGALIGWAGFERVGAPAAAENPANEHPRELAPLVIDHTPLIYTAIAVGILALAALSVFIWAVLRTRRAAASTD